MEIDIKINVIVISYKDNKKALKKVFKAWQQQVNVNTEIILTTVKDDPSVSVAKKMGVKTIVLNDKPSIPEQLNNGYNMASGKYVTCAGGHDIPPNDKLLNEVQLCESLNVPLCYSDFYNVDEKMNIISYYKAGLYDYIRHLKGNFVPDNALCRLDILRKYLPLHWEYDNSAYWDLWLRIAEGEGEKSFVYNNKPGLFYIQNGKGRHTRKLGNKKLWNHDEKTKCKMLQSHGCIYEPIPYELRYGNKRRKTGKWKKG